jgi:calcium-dependent protein kinase
VAIKAVKTIEMDSEELDRLDTEVRVMTTLSHRNLVGAIDVLKGRKNIWIVQPLMRGGCLRDAMGRQGPFTEFQAMETLRSMVNGLQYMHSKGVVHRDIKPENVLLESRKFPLHARIGDFGVSEFLGEGGYAESQCLLGTMCYMAPEQVRGGRCGPSIDMWACGVVLYEMLSGTLPFDGTTVLHASDAILTGDYSFPSEKWSSVSEGAKNLIRNLLRADPVQRLSAKEVLDCPWMAQ